jgi:L-ascorbate metabolism protein UlaG (beta-lactamase superfamily)
MALLIDILNEFFIFSSQGVENVIGFNIGGSVNVQGITVSMTPAFHSSGISGKGENTVYGGEPVGYVIELENGLKLHHAGASGYSASRKKSELLDRRLGKCRGGPLPCKLGHQQTSRRWC